MDLTGLDEKSSYEMYMLMEEAAHKGDIDTIERLYKLKGEAYNEGYKGVNVIAILASKGRSDLIRELLGKFPLKKIDTENFSRSINYAIIQSDWHLVDTFLELSSEYEIPVTLDVKTYLHLVRKGYVDLIGRFFKMGPSYITKNQEKNLFKSMIEEAIKLEKWDDAFILFDLGKQSHGRIEMIVYACATNNIPLFIKLTNMYTLANMLRERDLSERMQFVHIRIGRYASKDTAKILLYKYDIPKLDQLETNIKIVRRSKRTAEGNILADVSINGKIVGQLVLTPSQPPMETRVSILWELLSELVIRSDKDAMDLVSFFCDKLKYLLDTYNRFYPYQNVRFGPPIDYSSNTLYNIYKYDNKQHIKEIIKLKHIQETLLYYYIDYVMKSLEEGEIIELLNYNPIVQFDKLINLSIDKGYIKLIFYVIKDYEKYMSKVDNVEQFQRGYISDINLLLSLLIEKNVLSGLNREHLEYFEQLVKLFKEKYSNLELIETLSPEQGVLFRQFSTLLNDLFNMIRDYRPHPDDNMRLDARQRMISILGGILNS